MPPRAITDRSPSSVMRYNNAADDYSSCSSSVGTTKQGGGALHCPKGVRIVLEANEIFEITHLDDIPEDDVAATWYEADEYAEMKQSYQLTVFMMEAGEPLDPMEHTSRGLEYRTQEGAWARYENKRDAYNAVLDEQDRQWQVDVDDHDEIARIYRLHSAKCADAAAARAAEDEKFARSVLKSIIPPKRLSSTTRKKSSSNKDNKESKSSSSSRRSSSGERSKSSSRKVSSVVEKAQKALQQSHSSSSRRNEIRDDIKRLQKTPTTTRSSTKSSGSSSSSKSAPSSPKRDRKPGRMVSL